MAIRQRLFNWTHSWTVHSGIVSGIWPLFSRLQSKSSPEHAQREGHVLVSAPDPRRSLRNRRKTTAKPAKLRGCVEDHIFSGHTTERTTLVVEAPPIQRARNHCPDNNKKKIPNLVFVSTVDPYIQSFVDLRTVDETCKRKTFF